MKKRIISMLLAIVLVAGMLPTAAFAAEVCDHHPEHTADCGYAAAVEGSACTHAHDDACGYAEPIEEVLCACEAAEDGSLTHTEGCGYVAGVAGSDCTHTHDEACGYVEAAAGSECTYECTDCAAAEEEATAPAQITGVSITVDGVTYTEGNVTITPDTQSIVYTVTGTNFANVSTSNILAYTSGRSNNLSEGSWTIDTEANTAIRDFSDGIYLFESCNNFEVVYSNDGQQSLNGTGIYLTYDDGIAEEDKAQITGVSITVDGITYTEGNVTITPDTQSVVYTVTGSNLQNGTADQLVAYASGRGISVTNDYSWTFRDDGSSATISFPVAQFILCDNFEVTYTNDGQQSWTGTGIYLTYDDGTGSEEDTASAEITGVSITVDGITYTEGNVTITPTSTVVFTVTGTNFANVSADNFVRYASGISSCLSSGHWTIDTETNTATQDSSESIYIFASCNNYEIKYSNDGQQSWNGTGIYLTYDDGTGDEENTEPAVITGVSITVDGVTYTEGNVTITPTSTVVYTVTGTNFANVSEDNVVEYALGCAAPLNNGRWNIDAEANTATQDMSEYIYDFESCDNYEVKYSNDGQQSWNGTGIYLTYDDGTGDEENTEPAVITGVSITVDGVEYTSGNVTITPDTQSIVYTVTGSNLQNGTDDHVVVYAIAWIIPVIDGYGWTFSDDGSSATKDVSVTHFVNCDNFEVTYSNDDEKTSIGTGIYLTFVKSVPDSPGKIVVDMQDAYSDGWNDAAIEIYKNGSLEATATVDETFNTVSVDYDSTASYELKWVKGSYDDECSFTIYVDGETKLEVSNASTFTDSQTILTLEAAVKELAITKQPEDASAKLGENYCVEVIAEGEGLTYQWYFRNEGSTAWYKSSVTDNTYDDVMTTARAGREVYCVITDANGSSVTSETATLIAVKTAELAITTQPNDSSAKLDEMFCVTVEAVGDGLKYQWYWRQIGSETWNASSVRDNTYDDVMTSARHNREVYCVITDAWGDSVTTEIATITGTPTVTLEITRQPESQTVTIGDMFNVTFDAQGDDLKYQWYFKNSGTDVWYTSSQRDNSYDDVMTKARHDRSLYCVVTDAWGNSVTTDPVVVIMATQKHELAITAQPEDASAKLGEEFCVTVEAQGDELKYQWYWRNVGSETWNVSGQRDNTYDDVMTKARHNREVYCVITDMWGNSVETNVVTITGTPTEVLAIVTEPTDASAAMGENYCVTVEAQGDGLTYTWYFKNAGTDVWHKSGVTDNTYDDVMTKARAGRQVYCVITDIWGNSVTTETVTLVCTEGTQAIAMN